MNRFVVIAGKNDVACNALQYLVMDMRYPLLSVAIVATRNDTGRNEWQDSLVFRAKQLGVKCLTLEQTYGIENLLFLSLEFDRIIRPDKFSNAELYNFHFSKLPAYKGSGTSVLPILNGEKESAVTLHKIDAGVDTGPIVDQMCFKIEEWWTARELYLKFLSSAFDLYKKHIENLIRGGVLAKEQPMEGASHFRVGDVHYSRTEIDFWKTAYQIRNFVRAYSFWEFQLPTISGRKVLAVQVLGERATEKPGFERVLSEYESEFSTIDYKVRIKFSPYDDLYAWARGDSSDGIYKWVEDIDRQDKNGWSAAMIAAYYCKGDRLRILLNNGANVNQSNRRGTSLLMYAKSGAIIHGNFECLKIVLRFGADPAQKDAWGKTVFDYLEEEKQLGLIKFIQENAHDKVS